MLQELALLSPAALPPPRLHNAEQRPSVDTRYATPASAQVLVFFLGLCFAGCGLEEGDRAEVAADEMCCAGTCAAPEAHSGCTH